VGVAPKDEGLCHRDVRTLAVKKAKWCVSGKSAGEPQSDQIKPFVKNYRLADRHARQKN